MAQPTRFPEANAVWEGPGDVGDLPAFREDALSISCWELSAEELREVLDTGKVWLHVWGQHPPVYVTAEQPFEEAWNDDAKANDPGRLSLDWPPARPFPRT